LTDINNVSRSELAAYVKKDGTRLTLNRINYVYDKANDRLIDESNRHHVADPVANVERDTRVKPPKANAYQAVRERVRIVIVSYCRRFTDSDGRSAKFAIDGLVEAGVLTDDSPQYVESVEYRQVKVGSRSEEKTEIIIERLPKPPRKKG
jgi:hypothetical protein